MTSEATPDTLPSNNSSSSRSSKPLRSKSLNLTRNTRRWRMNRVAGVLFFLLLFLILYYKLIGKNIVPKKPVIIHADRYSKKYKYRPAASPVITEHLPGNTIVLRGAFRNTHQERDEL
ncbi:hypothetical protein FRB94_004516 [Tulasnella sp. JGI-2019a]|nr:hypothetical protein FRB93_003155 [Tulasnella sp. JGI-2019a]KAG9001801.1 hypothetical protein FRB94_004516 [Tulasnella sp. JGI-2019a]KAG9033047.1 hypothetical protein FRB95_000632 [Tulasnella sp. JGI-2019a]